MKKWNTDYKSIIVEPGVITRVIHNEPEKRNALGTAFLNEFPSALRQALLDREVRQDDWSDLGTATPEAILRALEEGRTDDAKRLARYLTLEGKGLHDLMCDWVWDLLTRIAERHGEEEMYRVLRASQETWMMKRTWKAFLRMPVEDRVRLTAEIARSHRCGPRQDGSVEIVEEEVLGERMQVIKNRRRSLRELLEASAAFGDKEYIVYEDRRISYAEHLRQAASVARALRERYGIEPGDIWWTASDVGWVVGHSYIVYAPLIAGATTIMYEGKPIGECWLQQMNIEHILARHPGKDLRRIDLIIRPMYHSVGEGGGILGQEDWGTWGFTIWRRFFPH